jgi:SET domain-containing protein
MYLHDLGRGVRVSKTIRQGEVIAAYCGELISNEEGQRREVTEPSVFRYFFSYKSKKWW